MGYLMLNKIKLIIFIMVVMMSNNKILFGQQFLNIPIEQHVLDNGLRVILSPNHDLPNVAITIYYDVGSRNEMVKKSGFAHLFEHLMFQGSKNVGKFEHITIVSNNGGFCNGTTSEDRTNYFETLPSHKLELGLWLEADRMRHLNVTKENFENQRNVVMEERRLRVDNQPYGESFIRINELAFGDYWPYAHSVIGDMEDLQNASVEDVQLFYNTYYVPNNAVIAIAGDFDPEETLLLIDKHFGSIPRGNTPIFQDQPITKQSQERIETISDQLAMLPAFHINYQIPTTRSPDHYPLEVLAMILGYGRSSRLQKALVEENQICQELYVSTDDRRGPDLFSIFGIINYGHTTQEARDIIYNEIENIYNNGLTRDELERTFNQLRSQFYFNLQTNMDIAQQLAKFALYWGDPTLIRTELGNYLSVTEDDIKRVINAYLIQNNRTVLDVIPQNSNPVESETRGE